MDRVLDVFPEHRETIVHLKLDKEDSSLPDLECNSFFSDLRSTLRLSSRTLRIIIQKPLGKFYVDLYAAVVF